MYICDKTYNRNFSEPGDLEIWHVTSWTKVLNFIYELWSFDDIDLFASMGKSYMSFQGKQMHEMIN